MRKTLSIFLIISFVATMLFGCGSLGGAATASLFIYNYDEEKTEIFEKMCQLYSEQSGRPVELINGKGVDGIKDAEKSDKPASVYMVKGIKDFNRLINEGFLYDFAQSEDASFISLAESIPAAFRLSTDGVNSYGLPVNIESYGLVADRKMLRDLFELANTDALVSDLANASFSEMQSLAGAVEAYLRKPAMAQLIIGGNDYRFAPTKTGLVEQLTGVYAIATGEAGYGTPVLNIATNAIYPTEFEALFTSVEKIEELRTGLFAYGEYVRNTRGFLAGDEGFAAPSEEIISPLYNKEKTLKRFADSKALFGLFKLSDFEALKKLNPEQAKRLVFVPIKLPFYRDDVKAVGRTPDIINSSLAVNAENFFVLNGKSDSALSQLGMDFLVWLYRSPEGIKILTEDFNAIPFNISTQKDELENTLAASVFWYKEKDKLMESSIFGTPEGWADKDVTGKVQEYLVSPNFTMANAQELADYAVDAFMAKK